MSIRVIAGDLLLTAAGTTLALEAFLMAAGCGILVLADSGERHSYNHRIPSSQSKVINATSCSHQEGFKGQRYPSRVRVHPEGVRQ